MKQFREETPLAMLGVAVAVSIPLVLGFLKELHPAFDSFAHFRAHLAVLLALAALPLLLTRLRMQGLAAIALGVGALTAALGAPALQFSAASEAGAAPSAADGPVYRLLHMNLRFDNPTPEKALSMIGRTQPDVIALNEVSAMWREKLRLLSARYPHGIVCPAPRGDVAILSRRPLSASREPRCFENGSLGIAAIDFGGASVDIAALHLKWPWPFGQPRQLTRLSAPLGSLAQTALLTGDFNAAPWSAATARVARAGGFDHVARIGPTWLDRRLPAALRPVIGLPIDQALSKGGVTIRSAERLDPAGSDHLPVLVEFSAATGNEPAVLQARIRR